MPSRSPLSTSWQRGSGGEDNCKYLSRFSLTFSTASCPPMTASDASQESPPSLLTITGANKSYNGIPALIDATLDLRAGEVHALVGENGAGKSTLIKLLAGVLPADTIPLTIRGRAASIHSPQAAFDLGLRFIHQELNV